MAYFEHCVECDAFKALSLVRTCVQCGFTLMSSTDTKKHTKFCNAALRGEELEVTEEEEDGDSSAPEEDEYSSEELQEPRKPQKPSWMSISNYRKSTKSWKVMQRSTMRVPCKGCGEKFKAYRGSQKQLFIEFAYYMHCFEKCEACKPLIIDCQQCPEKFLDKTTFRTHQTLRHKQTPVRSRSKGCPEWMDPVDFAKSGQLVTRMTTEPVYCKGCSKEFKAQQRKGCYIYEFDFYSHCITQCELYKPYVQNCRLCSKKLLDEESLELHLRKEHPNGQ